MKRLMFEGCAGWLHQATGRTGVVLCAPLGHEAMWSHRAWRHLANDLAAAGVPVLRFDYPCTGDSAGDSDEPHFIGRAVASIVAAAAQLRTLAGVDRIVLCGLRLGATLAVLAAEAMREHPAWHGGVDGLVLLAPVVSGRAYLRELRALHLSWLNSAGPAQAHCAPPEGVIDVLAFRIMSDTVREIETLKLECRAPCPTPRVLLLDAWPGNGSAAGALAQRYREAGALAELVPFTEYSAAMQSAESASVPTQAWQQVISWLAPDMAAAPALPDAARHERRTSVASGPRAVVDGTIEESVWLDGGRQFGVLCLPRDGVPAPAAVIFPNTGGNHHVGDGRLYVTLSRRLARLGVVSLRLDVAALGDSPGAHRQMSIPAIYSPGPRADVSAAVDWMRARGFGRIVLAGVCSGAFLSLQTALANPGVNGLVMANLLKFRWDRADDAMAGKCVRSWQSWLAAARHAANWQRLLYGDARLVPLAVAAMAQQAFRRVSDRLAFQLASWRGDENLSSVTSYARAAVRDLDGRRVRTDFLYGSEDIGLEEARLRFGKDLGALARLTHVAVHRYTCLDHALFLTESRQAFCDHVVRHIEQQLADAYAVQTAVPVTAGAGLADRSAVFPAAP
ncbi:Serine aminopeptidase S33 domain-containing protein [Cupriavidus necator]|uniref:serine aminopeptidase domain-containing protein n=1 Tax=Cupriavidus necator TaxID=106590 RepID=UPI003F73AD41